MWHIFPADPVQTFAAPFCMGIVMGRFGNPLLVPWGLAFSVLATDRVMHRMETHEQLPGKLAFLYLGYSVGRITMWQLGPRLHAAVC